MRAILVTGTSKGIGEACALHLAGQGHLVFAGVRNPQDGVSLQQRAGERVVPVRMDVTSADDIMAATETIRARVEDRGLYGLVNNAGIGMAGPLEFMPIPDLRRLFEVNVLGQIAVTQAVLPLLRQATGRIVNISSISGRSALPFTGAYAASKHAIEALSDALRIELRPWNLHVSVIEPGVIATPIWQTSLEYVERMIQELPSRAIEYYGHLIDTVKKRVMADAARGLPAERVAEAVAHALFARKPRTRYVVGRDARARLMLERLPDSWRDRIIARRLEKITAER